MARQLDIAVLTGFVEEAKGYLPVVQQSIKNYQADPRDLDDLELAYRHIHTIKGAASMVGLTGLSHVAYYLEETLKQIGAGQLAFNDETVAWLNQTLSQIEAYLDHSVTDSTTDEVNLVSDITRSYRLL